MGTSVNFEGFHEPSKTKTGYEFTIGKSEDEGLCRIDILFTDHSLELGKGNTVRIATISIPKFTDKEPYNDTHIELLSTYGKASAYFYDSTPDEESKYKTFTLTKRHD